MLYPTTPLELPDAFVELYEIDVKRQKDLWFLFHDGKLLIDESSSQLLQSDQIPLKHQLYMGYFKEYNLHVGEIENQELPPEASLVSLRALYGKIEDPLLALAGKASQLILWEKSHQYCGQCGERTQSRKGERAKECPSCQLIFYPKICPVIMVLIKKQDEILLARGINFPAGFYSALAGFVDSGESIEHCIQREVMEEVGLRVHNLRYFCSQSWPFPHSLMIAFICDWQRGEIRINPAEIVDAQWFKKDNLPLLPPHFSISRVLIDSVLNE